jgi:hypothetical protein
MLGGVVQGNTDQPRMQIRLGAQQADPLLLAAVEFLKAADDLPDVRASGECGTPIIRTPDIVRRIMQGRGGA